MRYPQMTSIHFIVNENIPYKGPLNLFFIPRNCGQRVKKKWRQKIFIHRSIDKCCAPFDPRTNIDEYRLVWHSKTTMCRISQQHNQMNHITSVFNKSTMTWREFDDSRQNAGRTPTFVNPITQYYKKGWPYTCAMEKLRTSVSLYCPFQ